VRYTAEPWSYKDYKGTLNLVLFTDMSKAVDWTDSRTGFTQDDAHIFCTPEQLDEEFKVIDLYLYVFGFRI
jgi:threonyl-tRNA synthetase